MNDGNAQRGSDKEMGIAVDNLTRRFEQGGKTLTVLDAVSFAIPKGEIVALTGASGSGKSTLLQTVGLLDDADEGRVAIDGQWITGDDATRTAARRDRLGFVYQFHHLLPDFTAIENVALAAQIAGSSKSEARQKAAALLAEMGLSERLDHTPGRLSGGEQQRVAIARALVNDPSVILADEPTGNLDDATSDRVFDAFKEHVKKRDITVLIATHDVALASRMDRRLQVKNGAVTDISA